MASGSARSETILAAVEAVVLDVLESLVASACWESSLPLDPAPGDGGFSRDDHKKPGKRKGVHAQSRPQPVLISLSDPRNALIAEDGGFRARTPRHRHLSSAAKSLRRLARFWGALDAAHWLNSQHRSANLRELFYRFVADSPRLFKKQADMDAAIFDVMGTLRVGRPQLGVLATEKGLLAGTINVRSVAARPGVAEDAGLGMPTHAGLDGGVGGDNLGGAAMAIGESMLDEARVQIDPKGAHCVLVVEKDSFFQQLLQGRLLGMLPLILVTGRGYPDILTRRFLQRLHRIAPTLPQVYLGDYDPHGAAIFFLYRSSCPALRWLGLHAEDVRGLPQNVALPFSTRDRALRESLLKRHDVNGVTAHLEQVQAMEQKFELEALYATHGAEGTALRFIPDKILRRQWM